MINYLLEVVDCEEKTVKDDVRVSIRAHANRKRRCLDVIHDRLIVSRHECPS
jgi:hypothetical protein